MTRNIHYNRSTISTNRCSTTDQPKTVSSLSVTQHMPNKWSLYHCTRCVNSNTPVISAVWK